MPLKEIRDYKTTSIGIWSMSEPTEDMAAIVCLTGKEQTELSKFSGEHRKREFMAVRLLLAAMMDEPDEIVYIASGKPMLTSKRKHISISHSRDIAALILSDYPAGIDTEETRRKLEKIAPRFLSEEELAWTRKSRDPKLAQIYCWSAKESLYKLVGQKGINFRTDLFLPATEISGEGSAKAYYRITGKFTEIKLNFFFAENNVITWCVNPMLSG